MPEQDQAQNAIELTAPRSFTLRQGDKTYTLTTRRVTPDDWRAYFAGLHVTSRQDGEGLVQAEEVWAARVGLATSVLTGAAGYKLALQDSNLTDVEGWQKLVPLAHRLSVGTQLASAARLPADELIYPDATPVRLSAAWGSDAAGNLQVYSGLVHYLQQPSDAQFRQYIRAASESRVLGGSRQGETHFLGAQMVAAALYDELVVKVEGYTANGAALTSREHIAAEMDTHHKVVAALAVLQPQQDVIAQTA